MTGQDSAAEAKDRRSGITLRELEVLQALVAEGTAINAARRLGISQSAASRRLAQLEERLGLQLFMRSGGRLVPTVEALSINEQLTPVFDTLSRIANHHEQPARSHGGTLSIAAPPTIAHRFLAARIAAFKKRNPELRITFEVLASDALLTGIAECRFDVGLTDTMVTHEGIRTEPLLETQAICILPAQHPLAESQVIRPEDLQGADFIALSRRHSSRVAIDRVFDRAGVRMNNVIEASTNVSAMEFVREGLGAAVLNPFPLVHQMGEGIVMRPFAPALRYVTNFLLPASRAPSAATLDFIAATSDGLDRRAYPELSENT
ncbi:LysR substrate-binding domain-containing protein [Paracoccus sp. 1_MG-2023]|uniref:LysR substrate-binding domain-containing protein n=1 Tax=unclassified Paracoccus (in: a-proteobacteria) TaxID=2688777 RepID=UPI001C08FBE2|nr:MULTISPECIES: LysR substrate-binding domain-containing protein [unclassified Paracoccus (in: a-proteobacteria)]MBU2958448.1 LysR family transcriptional regulator [Paracoccus sp. C2R09]MDO6668567.1 LysR substrate-binding domain-containing protein [Paracoccus sp. 1_MG-2023]